MSVSNYVISFGIKLHIIGPRLLRALVPLEKKSSLCLFKTAVFMPIIGVASDEEFHLDFKVSCSFSRYLTVQSQQYQDNVSNLFEVNHTDNPNDVVLISFLFHNLFWFLNSWLWTSKYRLGIHFKIFQLLILFCF